MGLMALMRNRLLNGGIARQREADMTEIYIAESLTGLIAIIGLFYARRKW